MKKNIIIIAALFVAVMSVTFLSCTKESEVVNSVTPENQTVVEIPKYSVKEGILVFNSREDLNKLNNYLADKSSEFIDKWENEIGFTSQQSILEQAIIEENAYYEQFDPTTLTEEEIEAIVAEKEKMGYTEFTKKYIAEGIIRPYITDDINSLELTTFSWVNARFLNLDGIVAVNDTIYQFTETQCKKLTDGDFSKIEMLKKSNEDNIEQNLIIGNVDIQSKEINDLGDKSLTNGDNSQRLDVFLHCRREVYSSGKTYNYYFHAYNYKKNIWGKWKSEERYTSWAGLVRVKVGEQNIVTYSISNYITSGVFMDVFYSVENIPLSQTITFSDGQISVTTGYPSIRLWLGQQPNPKTL